MSTINPIAPLVPGAQGEFGGVPVVADNPTALGLPDAATIAQLANALFGALPGRPAVPGTAVDAQAAPPSSALAAETPLAADTEVASQPAAAYIPPTSGFAPPSEAELRAAPASLAGVGGVADPATAANPSGDPAYYFLEPEGVALPGAAVGIGPTAATRLESGTLPTEPSPPAAFAQPAEPDVGPLPGPFAFRPELFPDPGSVPSGTGASAPAGLPLADVPAGVGTTPPSAVSLSPSSAAQPTEELGPRGSVGGPGLPPLGELTSGSSLYFLAEAGSPFSQGAPEPTVENLAYPAGFPEFGVTSYPLDSRLAPESQAKQTGALEPTPTGGAPATIPGHDAAKHPQRVESPPPLTVFGIG